jgi:hypothetical protein
MLLTTYKAAIIQVITLSMRIISSRPIAPSTLCTIQYLAIHLHLPKNLRQLRMTLLQNVWVMQMLPSIIGFEIASQV